MKTKEEVIKEDWVLFGVDSDESYDGWIPAEYVPEEAILSGMLDLKNFRTSTDYDEPFYRPKSLQNIEDNNGWISINSEKDLKVESGFYEVYNTRWKGNEMSIIQVVEPYTLDKTITHYKRIYQSNPPLHK